MDKDALTLANRISMLENEERKVLKKIDETRKRAEQIFNIKQINDLKY